MKNNYVYIWAALIAVALIAIGAWFHDGSSSAPAPAAGGITTGTAWPHGISVGLASTSPTNFAALHGTTCALIVAVGNATQSASTTRDYDCSTSGVVVGEIITATFGTTTSWTGDFHQNQWYVMYAHASTTKGITTVGIYNGTGANLSISAAGIGSTTVIRGSVSQ